MRTTPVLLLVLMVFVSISYCKDLFIGNRFKGKLIWQQKAVYDAIPSKMRVEDVYFMDPRLEIIKGIIVRDLDHTDATATVTQGGIGFSYVNIRLKSHKGSRLNYQIGIYV